MSGRHERDLGEEPSVLQVAIGDVAVGVVGGHQPGLDSRRERLPPEVTVSVGVVVDATHASLRSISGTQELGSFWDDLC